MQCKWNLSHTIPDYWCQPVLEGWHESQVKQVQWQEMSCTTCRHADLQCSHSIRVQQQCAACKKLVNPQPLRLECTFLGRKWLFPWKAQLPRVCMRSMEKVISSEYDSECLSTGLSYWLQRKLNLCRSKLAFVNTLPLLPLSWGSYGSLDMVSPLQAHCLLKFGCCRPRLREACPPEHRMSCWILLCPFELPWDVRNGFASTRIIKWSQERLVSLGMAWLELE